MPNEPLLEVSGIECGYGQVQVLWGVELDVYEHETVVLLGANGAGKTALLKTILGLIPAWGGRVLFRGADITHLRTDLSQPADVVFHNLADCDDPLSKFTRVLIKLRELRPRRIDVRAWPGRSLVSPP